MIILVTEEKDIEQELRGILINEAAAKESPCRCYEIPKAGGAKAKICFSKGIVGALSPEQINKFCPTTSELKSELLEERTEKFIKCSKEAEAKKLGLFDRIQFMSKCLTKE